MARGKPPEVYQKCLAGGRGHTGHLTTADNCIMFGVSNPTRGEYECILRLREAALAQDDIATRAAMDRGKSPTQARQQQKKDKKEKKKEKSRTKQIKLEPTKDVCEGMDPDGPLTESFRDIMGKSTAMSSRGPSPSRATSPRDRIPANDSATSAPILAPVSPQPTRPPLFATRSNSGTHPDPGQCSSCNPSCTS